MDPRIGRQRVVQMRKYLQKKTKKGFAGYPAATWAFYGPDDKTASKLVVAIVAREGAEPDPMRKWFAESGDLRDDAEKIAEAIEFMRQHGVHTVVAPERIIGCPHEEGVDYEGPTCPKCPFWAIRDRWTGEVVH